MGTLDNEFVKFGKTIADVMKHRGKASDVELDANIGFVLLDKEEREGLAAFSGPERNVYAVEAMIREVNNGGWSQLFGNSSGALAADLVPALKAIGAAKGIDIAERALAIFGKPKSLSDEDRSAHLARITDNYEKSLWDELDGEYYDNGEDYEGMIVAYIAKNLEAFR
jgi:uncharacterized protein DUF4375